MESYHRLERSKAVDLPCECNFIMQQWLYRRAIHTKRYRKRYTILYNDKLYTFAKTPALDKCDPQELSNVLKTATNVWDLTGSTVSAEPDVIGGLYRWKIVFRKSKKVVTSTEKFMKFISNKQNLSTGYEDSIHDVFEKFTQNNTEPGTNPAESQDHVWFAATNHKVATDWVIALIQTSRYGSLYNVVYKNPFKRKYLQFTPPWFLEPFDFFPSTGSDVHFRERGASFTYMKISISRLFNLPISENVQVYCVVEFGSSFYSLPLYKYEYETIFTFVPSINEDSTPVNITETGRYYNTDHGSLVPLRNFLQLDEKAESSEEDMLMAVGAGYSYKKHINVRSYKSGTNTGMQPGTSVITRLLNLNANNTTEKNQVVEKKSIMYNKDACIYIPILKNTSQEIIWIHFFHSSDNYIGSASIKDLDIGIKEPATVKTCMIKVVHALNPLNYKRIEPTDYSLESTVLSVSNPKDILNNNGFVELSVIIPRKLGDFFYPVTLSFGSHGEYVSKATKASVTAGVQMLMSNIRRIKPLYKHISSLWHYIKSVLEFKHMERSFFWLAYLIFSFGVFPNRLLLWTTLPIIRYLISNHPSFKIKISEWLLRYPILIFLLPRYLIYPYLVLPKSACVVCCKKHSFLRENAQSINPDAVYKTLMVSRYFHTSDIKSQYFGRDSAKYVTSCATKIAGKEQKDDIQETADNPYTEEFTVTDVSGVLNVPVDNVLLPLHGSQPEHTIEPNSNLADKSLHIRDYSEKKISVYTMSIPLVTSKHVLNDSVLYPKFSGTQVDCCSHRGIVLSYLAAMFFTEMGESVFSSINGGQYEILDGFHQVFYNPPPYRTSMSTYKNVIFTIKYFLYMIFLTCFGGISDINILHLMHKNKLFKKLSIESTSNKFVNFNEICSGIKGKKLKVYENERRFMFGNFSSANLRFYERSHFSTEDGKDTELDDLSKYNAHLVINSKTDKNGWVYAKNWNAAWVPDSTAFTFVRRRQWILTLKYTDISKRRPSLCMYTSGNMGKSSFKYAGGLGDIQRRSQTEKEPLLDKTLSSTITTTNQYQQDTGRSFLFFNKNLKKPEKQNNSVKKLFSRFKAFKERKKDQGQYEVSPLKDPPKAVKTKSRFFDRFKISLKPSNLSSLETSQLDTLEYNSSSQNTTPSITPTGCPSARNLYTPALPSEEQLSRREISQLDSDIQSYTSEISAIDDVHSVTSETPYSSEDTNTLFTFKLMEAFFALLIVLLICVILDMAKISLEIIWMIIKLILGMKTTHGDACDEIKLDHEMSDAARREYEMFKKPYICTIVPKDGRNWFKLRKRRRCFMLPERLRMDIEPYISIPLNTFMDDTRDSDDIESHRYNPTLDSDFMTEESGVEGIRKKRTVYGVDDFEDSDSSMDSQPIAADFFNDDIWDDKSGLKRISSVDLYEDDLFFTFSREKGNDDSVERMESPHLREDLEDIKLQKEKRGTIYRYIRSVYRGRTKKTRDETGGSNPLSDYDQDSDDDASSQNKLSVIGMLRKFKDKITYANCKINLYMTRYEKFVNMFSWMNSNVTMIISVFISVLALLNCFLRIETLLLFFILLQFEAGYKSGTWERNILYTTKRHLDRAFEDLEIFRPLWDLSNHQINALLQRIKEFSSIELSVSTIRESKDAWQLAYTISNRLAGKTFYRDWRRQRWIDNLFRRSPCDSYTQHTSQ
ncbi:hypothetical protein BEWA_008810 [Theileria equi strain WA]|uniref:PH domain-containing protein n=1 Tax=Theileria equi strain WA TaxID=1537102 RepID=L0B2Z1_THEEQ|nr:hypothetical protein BEWA_008810 [Theileria equi strain WA]AFZ81469.1 hypothetical protein BEWA_008810 [Theileria equi strain WA]|eukprot:XP_004831135.1 hypothetical protein BEWA_008810 [Theileria equi strain WA]